MLKKLKLALILLCVIANSFAQTPVIDSLKRLVSSAKQDTVKLHSYNELAYEYLSGDVDSAVYFARTAIKKYGNNSNRLLVSDSYSALGSAYGYMQQFDSSLANFKINLKILETTKSTAAIAKSHANIGLVYFHTSNYQEALKHYLEALKLLESIKDTKTLPSVYNGLGSIYKDIANYPQALSYYGKGMAIDVKNNDSTGMAMLYNNIGNVYDYQDKFAEALDNYKKSMIIKRAKNNIRSLPSTLNNIGIILGKMGQPDSAVSYYNQALTYSLKNNDMLSQAVSLDGIGLVYYQKKDYTKALDYLEKSLAVAKKVGSKMDLISTYTKLALCYAAKGNYKKAYDYQEVLLATKDSVLNKESESQINEMAAKYESEKKELQIDNLNKDNQINKEQLNQKELEVKHQHLQMIFIAIALFLVSILAFFVFRSYRIKKHSNEIITNQKYEVEQQRDLIEAKNKEITDSIQYAKRIQQALLASATFLDKNLPDHFVLHKPKDIVSGDFYWATMVDNKFMMITGDCTGHGVPGAFMSLLNMSFLNEAIVEKQILSPEKILEYVRTRIISALNPEGTETKSSDGMDAVLCMYDFKGQWLRFACANNPLWVVRKNEIIEFKPDKMPVGIHYGEQKEFTLHTLGLRKGDIVYTFTDGFADQFGGPQGKKFKYKQLQSLLLQNVDRPMVEQKQLLESTFESWRGNHEQIDDVLVIGIRI